MNASEEEISALRVFYSQSFAYFIFIRSSSSFLYEFIECLTSVSLFTSLSLLSILSSHTFASLFHTHSFLFLSSPGFMYMLRESDIYLCLYNSGRVVMYTHTMNMNTREVSRDWDEERKWEDEDNAENDCITLSACIRKWECMVCLLLFFWLCIYVCV